jgi:hypothetical protein
MMISIMQPAYLPWLGYFHRVAISDVHVVLDHVQMGDRSFTNRNRIRTAKGWSWLTVPVETGGQRRALPICELAICGSRDWANKHWKTLTHNYARAPFFHEHQSFFADLYGREWKNLAELLRESTDYLLGAFGIKTPLRFSSQMHTQRKKNELIVELCRRVQARVYISGPLGRDYLQEQDFAAAGIELRYHDYQHPEYRQLHPGFEPFMSAVDLLFNHGPASREILMRGQSSLAKTAVTCSGGEKGLK